MPRLRGTVPSGRWGDGCSLPALQAPILSEVLSSSAPPRAARFCVTCHSARPLTYMSWAAASHRQDLRAGEAGSHRSNVRCVAAAGRPERARVSHCACACAAQGGDTPARVSARQAVSQVHALSHTPAISRVPRALLMLCPPSAPRAAAASTTLARQIRQLGAPTRNACRGTLHAARLLTLSPCAAWPCSPQRSCGMCLHENAMRTARRSSHQCARRVRPADSSIAFCARLNATYDTARQRG